MDSRVMPTNSLLIRNIHTLVLMDAENQVLRGGYIYAENGAILSVGSGAARLPKADRVIDGRHCIALPGLVNTHHHLYQTLTRAYAPAADAKLFDWLRTLYPIWARLDEECVHVAALAGMAELLLSGCTTTSDHHYLFPRGRGNLIDAQIEAARRSDCRGLAGTDSGGRSWWCTPRAAVPPCRPAPPRGRTPHPTLPKSGTGCAASRTASHPPREHRRG